MHRSRGWTGDPGGCASTRGVVARRARGRRARPVPSGGHLRGRGGADRDRSGCQLSVANLLEHELAEELVACHAGGDARQTLRRAGRRVQRVATAASAHVLCRGARRLPPTQRCSARRVLSRRALRPAAGPQTRAGTIASEAQAVGPVPAETPRPRASRAGMTPRGAPREARTKDDLRAERQLAGGSGGELLAVNVRSVRRCKVCDVIVPSHDVDHRVRARNCRGDVPARRGAQPGGGRRAAGGGFEGDSR